MSFMDRTRQHLEDGSEKGSPERRVINGRLYVNSGKNGIYTVVPRGMDDARDLKEHPVPDYLVKDGVEYQVTSGKDYAEKMQEAGAKVIIADKADRFAAMESEDYELPKFIQADRNLALMIPGEDGQPVLHTMEAGDYLGMSGDSYYAVPAEEFDQTYAVMKDPSSEREIPEVEDDQSEYEDSGLTL